jgi:hypothetical protein
MAVSRFPLSVGRWRSLDWGAIALGAVFFSLYFCVGAAIANSAAYGHQDLLFGADLRRIMRNMTQGNARPMDTVTHTLFLLLTTPVTMALAAAIGDRRLAVALVMALIGALGVILARSIFRRLGASPAVALGGAVLFGLSASQVWFSATPETFGLGGLSLLCLWAVALRSPGQPWPNLGPGLLAFGATATNLLPAAWVYGCLTAGNWRRRLRAVVLWGAIAIAVGSALHYLQYLIWPGAGLFWISDGDGPGHPEYFREVGPGRVLRMALYLVIFGVARPALWFGRTTEPYPPNLRFDLTQPTIAVALAQLLWLALVAIALYGIYRHGRDRAPVLWGVGGVLLFNGLLHTLYGAPEELFLYAPHWTGSLMVGVMAGLLPLLQRRDRLARAIILLAIALIVTQLAAHGEWIHQVLTVYRDPRYA